MQQSLEERGTRERAAAGFKPEKRRLSGHFLRKWLPLLLFLLPALAFAQDIQLSGFLQLDKRFNYGGSTVAIADFTTASGCRWRPHPATSYTFLQVRICAFTISPAPIRWPGLKI